MAKTSAETNSARLAKFVAGTLKRRLPAPVLEKAKHHLLDTLAAIVSGAEMEPGRQGIAYVRGQGGRRESSVLGSRVRTSAVNAALANAMSAHADETDDSHPTSLTHPGCAVVPAALAMAERGGYSGLALLQAVAAGYDICARVGLASGGQRFLLSGKDSHSFAGTIGAAAAAGALTGLDSGRTAVLLSYATQQAAGLSTLFRDPGHVEKAFVFAGMPSRNGVAAATMVQSGMTGVPDPFDSMPNYFSAHVEGRVDWAKLHNLGKPHEITRTNIKRWSVGSPAQAVLDSAEALILQHKMRPEQIRGVTVRLSPHSAQVVDRRQMLDINVQFLTAIMLVDGTVSFAASHDSSRLSDPRVTALRQRIRLVGDPKVPSSGGKRQAIVEVTLNDGRTLRHHTRAVRGTTDNPMTRAEVEAKVLDLFAPSLGAARSRRIIRTVRTLERTRRLDPLLALLQRR